LFLYFCDISAYPTPPAILSPNKGSGRRVGTLSRLASNSGATARRLSRLGSLESVSIHVIYRLTPPCIIFKQRLQQARGNAQPPGIQQRGDGAVALSLGFTRIHVIYRLPPPSPPRYYLQTKVPAGARVRSAACGRLARLRIYPCDISAYPLSLRYYLRRCSFEVLFSSCACVCRCRGCCSLSVCVCVCVCVCV